MRTLLLVFALPMFGCSSRFILVESDSGGGGVTCTLKNPAGDCCPTDDVGFMEGKRMSCSLEWDGFQNLNPSMKTRTTGPLDKIKLVDFYDPMAKKYRIIRFHMSSVWCGPCRMETQIVSMPMGSADKFVPKGMVFLQSLFEGVKTGTAATADDLPKWIMDNGCNTTQMIDPSARTFGAYKASPLTVPWAITVDARSMRILKIDANFTDETKLNEELQKWIDWTNANPPD